MRGDYAPGDALKPHELAKERGVSLAVVREALLRVVGEGLADRLPNRGFAVPVLSDDRWQEIAEARRTVEPVVLRLSIERGDLDWEARVRAAHHRLARTPAYMSGEGKYYSELARRWSAHRGPERDHLDEHRRLEEATLARDADTAAEALTQHLSQTAVGVIG